MEWQTEQQEELNDRKDSSDPLDCDICGKHICYVYDFDLNGSYFFCDQCKNEEYYKDRTADCPHGYERSKCLKCIH